MLMIAPYIILQRRRQACHRGDILITIHPRHPRQACHRGEILIAIQSRYRRQACHRRQARHRRQACHRGDLLIAIQSRHRYRQDKLLATQLIQCLRPRHVTGNQVLGADVRPRRRFVSTGESAAITENSLFVSTARCTAAMVRAACTGTNQAAARARGAANRRRSQCIASKACAGIIAQFLINVRHTVLQLPRATIARKDYVPLSGLARAVCPSLIEP